MARVPTAAGLGLLLILTAPAAAFDTDPGFSASFVLFPSHDEVVASMQNLEGHPWITLHTLGTSEEGRPILLAEVTDPDGTVPRDERVITFLFTQQHGNEPAGTPAALMLLDDLAAGTSLTETLDNQVLLVLPMANPDGASLNQRANQKGHDINRDHIGLETAEAKILHDVLNRWDVHVAMDHHEYGGTGLGNPFPVRVYDYDLTTLFPVHGNVRAPTDDAARALMYEGIWPAAQAAGFTANEYGEQTVAGVPVQQLAGGPDPGIMRNHLGLHHIAGLLVETRVDAHPNPFHDAERRQAIHSVVMEATLQYVHENAQMFRDAKRQAEADTLAKPATEYREGDTGAPLAAAYRAPAANNTQALFARHALPPAILDADHVIHDLRHAYQAHAAAIVHPASSRAVVDAEPTEPPAVVEPPAAATEEETPALAGVTALLALVGGLALARRRA